MKHVFRARKIGWEEAEDIVYFDANLYSKEEAESEFKAIEDTNRRGYRYTYYVYGGEKYYKYKYLGLFEDDNLPKNNEDIIKHLLENGKAR